MIIPPRNEPEKIKLLRILDKRMGLSPEDKKRYFNLMRGYEGEVLFDSLTAHLESRFFILKDLWLESNKTKFQIDSFIITPAPIIPCEVKNFHGDFVYKDRDFFTKKSEEKITNPLHQMDRASTLLRQLLQQNGFRPPIASHLFFVNPEFFLYNAPLEQPIVYPTQINTYLANLASRPGELNSNHRKLAEFLLSSNIPPSPYEDLPPYKYEQLQKGLTSGCCHSFSVTVLHKKLV